MQKLLKGVALAAVVLAFAACGSDDDPVDNGGTGGDVVTPAPVGPAVDGNVVELASGVADLGTLVAAIDAAGLTATLSQAGTFTVLAPTNQAFADLIAELNTTPEALLADQALLDTVLKYHVIESSVPSTAISLGTALTTLQSGGLKFEASSSALPLIFDGQGRSAQVTDVDIQAANAVVHIIDKVLLPADKNIVQFAQSRENLSFLVEAVTAAGLVETLSGDGPFTLLAPTNSAFDALLGELSVNKEQLLADTDLLTQVLTYHVIPGRNMRTDLPLGPVTTVQGGAITVEANDGNSLPRFVDERSRSTPLTDRFDAFVINGVVHEIGAVLLPAAPAP